MFKYSWLENKDMISAEVESVVYGKKHAWDVELIPIMLYMLDDIIVDISNELPGNAETMHWIRQEW